MDRVVDVQLAEPVDERVHRLSRHVGLEQYVQRRADAGRHLRRPGSRRRARRPGRSGCWPTRARCRSGSCRGRRRRRGHGPSIVGTARGRRPDRLPRVRWPLPQWTLDTRPLPSVACWPARCVGVRACRGGRPWRSAAARGRVRRRRHRRAASTRPLPRHARRAGTAGHDASAGCGSVPRGRPRRPGRRPWRRSAPASRSTGGPPRSTASPSGSTPAQARLLGTRPRWSPVERDAVRRLAAVRERRPRRRPT